MELKSTRLPIDNMARKVFLLELIEKLRSGQFRIATTKEANVEYHLVANGDEGFETASIATDQQIKDIERLYG